MLTCIRAALIKTQKKKIFLTIFKKFLIWEKKTTVAFIIVCISVGKI